MSVPVIRAKVIAMSLAETPKVITPRTRRVSEQIPFSAPKPKPPFKFNQAKRLKKRGTQGSQVKNVALEAARRIAAAPEDQLDRLAGLFARVDARVARFTLKYLQELSPERIEQFRSVRD